MTDNTYRHCYQHKPTDECDRKISAVLQGSLWTLRIGPNEGRYTVKPLDSDGSGYGTSKDEWERLCAVLAKNWTDCLVEVWG